jgi:hypothetical protein
VAAASGRALTVHEAGPLADAAPRPLQLPQSPAGCGAHSPPGHFQAVDRQPHAAADPSAPNMLYNTPYYNYSPLPSSYYPQVSTPFGLFRFILYVLKCEFTKFMV